MAKKYKGHAVKKRIAECKECNGNPKLVDFTTPTEGGYFIGKRCEICYEIPEFKEMKNDIQNIPNPSGNTR